MIEKKNIKRCFYFACSNTYGTTECHRVAIEPIRSLCSTMGLALRRQHFGNSFPNFAPEETLSAVECACVAFVSPIFGMEFQFWSHSLDPCNSDRYPCDNHLIYSN